MTDDDEILQVACVNYTFLLNYEHKYIGWIQNTCN